MAEFSFLLKYAQGIASLEEKGKLLESYNELSELQARVRELENENSGLRDALRFKSHIDFRNNVCVALEGDPGPYCPGCWDSAKQAVHLIAGTFDSNLSTCPVCRQAFRTGPPVEG